MWILFSGPVKPAHFLKYKVGQLLSLYQEKSWSHFLFIFRVFHSKLQRSLQSPEKASYWKWLYPVHFSAFNHWSDDWYLLGSSPSETGMESSEAEIKLSVPIKIISKAAIMGGAVGLTYRRLATWQPYCRMCVNYMVLLWVQSILKNT